MSACRAGVLSPLTRTLIAAGAGAVCAACLGGCGLTPLSNKTFADDATVASVKTVRLDNDSGNVTIRADAAATGVTIHRDVSHQGNAPGPSHRVEGDTVVLAGCGRMCSVDYTVAVPAGTAVNGDLASGDVELAGPSSVDLSMGSGQLTAHDVAGPLRAKVDSGDVTLKNIAGGVTAVAGSGTVSLDTVGGDVTVHSDSGDVRGNGLAGKAEVQAGSGIVRLDMTQPRDVRVRSDSGDIQVTVPRQPYRLTALSDNGAVKLDMADDPKAGQVLDLHAGSGDVTARYR